MAETLPFETTRGVGSSCLCLHVRRAARALSRRFDEAFRPLGLTNGQFSLLASLNRPEPPSIGEAVRVLAMDRTSLTAMLKPLERRGLVAVEVDPGDRRSRRVRLTERGVRLLRRAIPIWECTHAEVEALLAGVAPGAMRQSLRSLESAG